MLHALIIYCMENLQCSWFDETLVSASLKLQLAVFRIYFSVFFFSCSIGLIWNFRVFKKNPFLSNLPLQWGLRFLIGELLSFWVCAWSFCMPQLKTLFPIIVHRSWRKRRGVRILTSFLNWPKPTNFSYSVFFENFFEIFEDLLLFLKIFFNFLKGFLAFLNFLFFWNFFEIFWNFFFWKNVLFFWKQFSVFFSGALSKFCSAETMRCDSLPTDSNHDFSWLFPKPSSNPDLSPLVNNSAISLPEINSGFAVNSF